MEARIGICRDGNYFIEGRRLCEEHKNKHPYSWVAHTGGKNWVDVDDFTTAFFVACAMHGKCRDTLSMWAHAHIHPAHAFHRRAGEEFERFPFAY